MLNQFLYHGDFIQMRISILMLMLLIMSLSVSQPSFAKNFTQCDVIFAEEETKPSDDEEPDCE